MSEKSMAVTRDGETQAKVVESLVLRGDLSGLSPQHRARYYVQTCEQLGLNPSAKPFDFLRLNGKEILYANKGATDQLAAIHRVNREIIDGPKVIDLAGTKLVYAVCRASLPNGRFETATATVPLVDPMNVLMKAETKAKRRATMSILGLALLDEMELETIPANVQSPGGGVDLSRANDSADEHQVDGAETPAQLGEFYERIQDIELPGEAVVVWMRHRADLAPLASADREKAWQALCRRTEEVGKMKNAKVWLKKAIAEEDVRRSHSAYDPGAVLDGAGDTRAETPRKAHESEGVLGSLTDAPDVTELRRLAVEALRSYPALSDAIWTRAIAHAATLGCDEKSLRRMVAEAMGDDPQPPAGGGGGNATGGNPSATSKGRSGAQGATTTQRAANVVTELAVVSDAAQAIIDAHGTNPWALKNSLRKHREELRATDVEELARVLARITPPDPQTKALLNQVGAEKIVRGLTGLRSAA